MYIKYNVLSNDIGDDFYGFLNLLVISEINCQIFRSVLTL